MKRNGKNRWEKAARFARRFPVLAAIFAVQAVFLLALAVRSATRPAFTLTYTAADFTPKSDEDAGLFYYDEESESLCFTGIDTEDEANADYKVETITLPRGVPSGAYEVTADYTVDTAGYKTTPLVVSFMTRVLDTEGEWTDYQLVEGDGVRLGGVYSQSKGRFWVPMGAKTQGVSACVDFYGFCDAAFTSLTIQEKVVWRAVRWAAFALLFGLADGALLLFFVVRDPYERFLKRFRVPLALTLCTLFACLPLFADFLLGAHDLVFHLERIAAVAEELRYGQFPVRMDCCLLNGYGYALSIYYCDIFLYLPAILYNLMVPLQTCYVVYVLAVTGAACGIAYYCFRGISGSRPAALTGAAVYALSSYRLVNVYVRAAVGEYTAMTFLPLVALGFYRIYTAQKPAWRDWLPLALGMAGVLQCHLLSFELCVLFLALLCVLYLPRTLRRLPALLKAAGVCAALSAWFLVPLVQSFAEQTVKVSKEISPEQFQEMGLYLMQLFSLVPAGGGGSEVYVQQDCSFSLGLALILGLALAFVPILAPGRLSVSEAERRVQRGFLGGGLLAAVLTLRVFPWDRIALALFGTPLSALLSFQFPWRFLGLAVLCLTGASVLACAWLLRRNARAGRAVCAVLCAAAVFYASWLYMNQMRDVSEDTIYFDTNVNSGHIMSGEYFLDGSEPEDHYTTTLRDADDGLTVKWYEKIEDVAGLEVRNDADGEASVTLPLYAYKHYHAYDAATGEELPLSETENALLRLTVPQGYEGTVTVRYVPPVLWRVCEGVSLAAALMTAVVLFRARRAKKAAAPQRGAAQEPAAENRPL